MRLRNRGKNHWQLRWELGRDDQGQRRQRTETFYGNKKAAETRWRLVQAQIDGQPGDAWALDTLTVDAYLDRWWEQVGGQLAPGTQADYQSQLRRYIRPALGSVLLRQLTPLHIQDAIRHWSTQPRQDGKPGTLSASTVAKNRTVLNLALQAAVRWQLLAANPVAVTKAPPRHKKEILWWTPEEARQFLAVSDAHRLACAFRLALFGGLRLGEVLGLRWQDVDWQAKTLTIRQAGIRAGSSRPQIARPKSDRSARAIVVDDQILRILKMRQHAQKVERLARGGEATDLIVSTMQGRMIFPRYLEKLLDRLIAQAGVKHIRFHDLRHTHATWLAQAGVNPKVIADRLGHTNVAFTLQLYVHSDLADQAQALQQMPSFESPAP